MKDYTCDCCNKKWIDKTHYDIHMNTKKNTGEPRKKRTHKKPLVNWHCRLCNKDFSCKNNLRKHCLVRFETHAVYANRELGLDAYKEGYSADGKRIEEVFNNAIQDPDYELGEDLADNYEYSEILFNHIAQVFGLA